MKDRYIQAIELTDVIERLYLQRQLTANEIAERFEYHQSKVTEYQIQVFCLLLITDPKRRD